MAARPEGVYADGKGGWYFKATVGTDPLTGKRVQVTKRGFRSATRLFGESGTTAEAVTARLGIVPSKSFEAGTRTGPRCPAREQSGWLLSSSEQIEDGVELEEQLERLLAVLEPVGKELWSLVDEGCWANWWCFVESSAMEHATELPRELLTRLLGLPGDLWIDVGEGEAED
ncbi:MAG: hypothetical protein JWN67_3871 [Actinomycetia bacterium]|nr:hypothetical protein [Actinomycetes bacterium]